MAGSDRYSLLVESATRGEAELRRLSDALNSISSAAENAAKRSTSASASAAASTRGLAENLRGAIETPLGTAAAAVTRFAAAAGGVAGPAAAIALGVGLATKSALDFVNSVSAGSEEIVNLSDRTGLAIDQVDRFQAIGKIANVSVEALAGSTRKLAAFMGEFGRDGDQARNTLQNLGVSFFDSTGKARELGAVTEDLLSKLSGLSNQRDLVDITSKVFGKGSTELLPFIRNFKELDSTVRGLGFGSRTELIQGLSKANDDIDKLNLRFDILKGKTAEKLTVVVDFVARGAELLTSGLQTSRPFVGSPNQQAAAEAVNVLRQGLGNQAAFVEQQDQQARSRLAAGFVSSLSGTLDGRRNRIADIEQRSSELRAALSSGNVGTAEFAGLRAEFNRLEAERKSLERAIEIAQQTEAALRSALESPRTGLITPGIFQFRATDSPQPRQIIPTLRRPAEIERTLPNIPVERTFVGSGTFVAAGANAPIDTGRTDAIRQNAAFIEGLRQRGQRDRQLTLDILQQQVDFQTRLVELTAGPGGEEFAIRRTTELRLQALDAMKALGAEINVQVERTKILQDAEIARLSTLEQQKRTVGESFGRGFDALVSGGAGGIRSFALSGITGLGRQLTVNLGQEVASGVTGRLAFPGQRNADGSPTFLGRLFSNTFLADNNGLKTATDRNTGATELNTATLEALRSAIISGAGGGTVAAAGTDGGAAAAFGALSSIGGRLGLPAGILDGAGRNPFVFSAVPPGVLNRGRGLSLGAPELGVFDPGPVFSAAETRPGFFNQYGSTGATLAVDAAALAAGTFGVIRGLKIGGARGGLVAASSALGTAAALSPEPVSKAILATAAVASSVIASLLPDPKKVREAAIDQLGIDNAFTDPGSFNYAVDVSGRAYDSNIRGDVRPINITVQALDARSVIDRSEDIANAVDFAIASRHRLGKTIQDTVLQH